MDLFSLYLLLSLMALNFPSYASSSNPSSSTLGLLSYNTWHGLNGKGWRAIGELEPPLRKEKRIQWQIKEIKKVSPDVLILQEINPLKTWRKKPLSQKYAEALELNFVEQVDNCGIKIFSFGVPHNLSSGLVILAKKSFELKKIKGLKLSGSWGGCSTRFNFQLSEFRYALFASLKLPHQHPSTPPLLIVNTHLHHGIEFTPELQNKLQALLSSQRISQNSYQSIQNQLIQGRNRRTKEVETLMKEIESLKKDYSGIILAGDFNMRPSNPSIQKILNHGFFDLGNLKENPKSEPDFYFQAYQKETWNHKKNPNHRFQEHFPLPVNLSSFDEKSQKELKKLLKDFNQQPRRIDYIFVSKSMEEKVKSTFLFGTDSLLKLEKDSLIGSDHFGVLAFLQTPLF